MATPGDGEDWDQHLRAISLSARDSSSSSDPSVDASLLKSVQILHKTCKNENSGDLMARVYPQINRLFQRSLASPKFQSSENGLLLLAILQFFLDFGDIVLHDADPSLQSFFRLCLSRQFADPIVAEATLSFLVLNKEKILSSFPGLLPQVGKILFDGFSCNGGTGVVSSTFSVACGSANTGDSFGEGGKEFRVPNREQHSINAEECCLHLWMRPTLAPA